MTNSTKLNRIAIGALCAVAASLATAANAQNFSLTGASAYSQNISYVVNGVADNTYSGPYTATINGVPNIPVFCIDAGHDIGIQSFQADLTHNVTDAAGAFNSTTGYYNGGAASAMTASDYGSTNLGLVSAQQRADEIAFLADTYLGATSFASGTPSDNFAAIGIAIWDIVQDGGNGAYTGSGSYYMTSTGGYTSLIAGYEAQAQNYYASQVASGHSATSSDVVWIQAPSQNGTHLQEFLYINPVPEPGVIVTSVSLLGMVGLGMARGRRRVAKKNA